MAATRYIFFLPVVALIAIPVITAFIAAVVILIVLLVRRANRQTAASESEPPKRPLSEILREHRTRAGMTQEYVAEALGITRPTLNSWIKREPRLKPSQMVALTHLIQAFA